MMVLCYKRFVGLALFTIFKSFAGNMGKTLNNNDLGPVSRTPETFRLT